MNPARKRRLTVRRAWVFLGLFQLLILMVALLLCLDYLHFSTTKPNTTNSKPLRGISNEMAATLTAKDRQALEWAQANPTDPRTPAVTRKAKPEPAALFDPDKFLEQGEPAAPPAPAAPTLLEEWLRSRQYAVICLAASQIVEVSLCALLLVGMAVYAIVLGNVGVATLCAVLSALWTISVLIVAIPPPAPRIGWGGSVWPPAASSADDVGEALKFTLLTTALPLAVFWGTIWIIRGFRTHRANSPSAPPEESPEVQP